MPNRAVIATAGSAVQAGKYVVRPGDSTGAYGIAGRPEFAELTDHPLEATIVRVNRKAILEDGHVSVGMRFSAA